MTYWHAKARDVIARALDALGPDCPELVKGIVDAQVHQAWPAFIRDVPSEANAAARAGWNAARTALLAERFPRFYGKSSQGAGLFG